VDALPAILDRKNLDLFSKYKVYSEKELHSRYNILSENYSKTINIEGNLTSLLAETNILPAAIRYQTELAQNVTSLKAAGVEDDTTSSILKHLTSVISSFRKAVVHLDKQLAHEGNGDAYAHARY